MKTQITLINTRLNQNSQKYYMKKLLLIPLLTLLCSCSVNTPKAELQHKSFREAKLNMVEIFREMDNPRTLYCGCNIKFPKRGGYMPDPESCGYHSDRYAKNAKRIEAEHIMPAWEFGHKRRCWVKGHRRNCEHNDAEFQAMHADLHNLYPAIGEVNSDRNNYSFTDSLSDDNYHKDFISGKKVRNHSRHKVRGYGQCEMVIDRSKEEAMPPVRARGIIARAYLYMSSRYNIELEKDKKHLFQKWDKMYAPDKNECLRNSRIRQIQGHDNPFVSRQCHY